MRDPGRPKRMTPPVDSVRSCRLVPLIRGSRVNAGCQAHGTGRPADLAMDVGCAARGDGRQALRSYVTIGGWRLRQSVSLTEPGYLGERIAGVAARDSGGCSWPYPWVRSASCVGVGRLRSSE
jgi:hypothetical protein